MRSGVAGRDRTGVGGTTNHSSPIELRPHLSARHVRWTRKLDSNQRGLAPADLQSAAFDLWAIPSGVFFFCFRLALRAGVEPTEPASGSRGDRRAFAKPVALARWIASGRKGSGDGFRCRPIFAADFRLRSVSSTKASGFLWGEGLSHHGCAPTRTLAARACAVFSLHDTGVPVAHIQPPSHLEGTCPAVMPKHTRDGSLAWVSSPCAAVPGDFQGPKRRGPGSLRMPGLEGFE